MTLVMLRQFRGCKNHLDLQALRGKQKNKIKEKKHNFDSIQITMKEKKTYLHQCHP